FEAIFINCGASTSNFTSTAETNLKNFVEVAGKSLYASDWAAAFVEPLWPSAIDFYGSNSTATATAESISAAKVGTGSKTVEATVIDSNLINNVLGKSTISIYYDLGGWVVISGEGTDTTVLLRGSPTISGSSANVLSESVRASGISASGTASDEPLAVQFKPAGASKGTVVYTTFHNEAQENLVTADMEKMLQYFIITL
ncbi:MAG: hypothetical protein HY753_05290, partial [Nitrospirae bacterium]|nr:hypothetical protein [Nitrospirota bacterium]